MRKASKTRNHILMTVGIVQGARQIFASLCIRGHLRQGLESRHAALLHGGVFGVFQRQIHEHAYHFRQLHVGPAVQRFQRQRQRLGVPGKALGRVAVNVAGELIEQQHQSQMSPGSLVLPMLQCAAQGRLHCQAKALAQLFVKSRRLGEPLCLVQQGFAVAGPGTA